MTETWESEHAVIQRDMEGNVMARPKKPVIANMNVIDSRTDAQRKQQEAIQDSAVTTTSANTEGWYKNADIYTLEEQAAFVEVGDEDAILITRSELAKIMRLLEEIQAPTVFYVPDLLDMANSALSNCAINATDIEKILKGK